MCLSNERFDLARLRPECTSDDRDVIGRRRRPSISILADAPSLDGT